MQVTVIGLGYIGLPTAAALATSGTSVVGVDVRTDVVDAVNSGQVPFVEPDLDVAVAAAVASGHLTATFTPPHADVYVVAVPTPFLGDRAADLSYVENATRTLAKTLEGGELVILESTSPPGTTELMADWVTEERPDLPAGSVLFAHCPERVLPGRVMIELVENDRVIGGVTPEAAERAANLYRTFCRGALMLTDARTAELAKLVENSFRDVNIAFANELSRVCDELDVDVWKLIELANHHPRVNILRPGPGVGGHCIAVDPWFIIAAAPEATPLIRTAREVNDAKPQRVVADVVATVRDVDEPRIALLGLAFKPNIDDLRESPAVEIARRVAEALPEAAVLAVEPHVDTLPSALGTLPNVRLTSFDDAVQDADLVAVLVGHDAFLGLRDGRLGVTPTIDTVGLLSV